jgi:hypothetical protein
MRLRAEGEHQTAIFGAQLRNRCDSLCLCLLHPIALAHAEGIVHRHDEQFAAARGCHCGGVDEGARKGEGQQSYQRCPQGEQEQITQAAMFERTLRAALEEH